MKTDLRNAVPDNNNFLNKWTTILTKLFILNDQYDKSDQWIEVYFMIFMQWRIFFN